MSSRWAVQKKVTFDKIPGSLDEFIKLRETRLSTMKTDLEKAFFGAALYALALLIYSENKKVGLSCIVASVDRKCLGKDEFHDSSVKGWMLTRMKMEYVKRMHGKEYMAKAFVHGNKNPTPDNQYAFDPSLGVEYRFGQQNRDAEYEKSVGTVKFFITCTGSSMEKPVYMRKNNRGIYKMDDIYLIHGIQPPKVVVDDDI